ncbi:MAG: alkaline phosphatase family protein, partial [Phycisphaerae bacterium]
ASAAGGIFASFAQRAVISPITPAVTCSMQATLTTGATPAQHGIVCNGLYTYNNPALQQFLDADSFSEFRRQISFWEQSNRLLQTPRFWAGKSLRTAMLFWQQSMPDAADIVLTPKPEHTPDGKTVASCFSRPHDLYRRLTAKLGAFPLHQYWGPMASLPSSQWIINAAMEIWRNDPVDLQMVYVPHLDYNLQRLGPDHPTVAKDAAAVAALVEPLVEMVRASGGVPIIAGDYSMHAVSKATFPNRALRDAGLLRTRPDAEGKLLIDFTASRAVAMVDHQIAYVYCAADAVAPAQNVLQALDGIGPLAVTAEEKACLGLDTRRAGQIIAMARQNVWFAHDWWHNDSEKPRWQFSVDIHRKPGYDPRELFFDPAHSCIAQDTALVKGSHGVVGPDAGKQPVLLCDTAIPARRCKATDMADWLLRLVR